MGLQSVETGMGKRTWSDNQIKELERHLISGLTYRKISELTGRTRASLLQCKSRHLKHLGKIMQGYVRGNKHHNFNNYRSLDINGYIVDTKKMKREHRLIAERVMGRPLKREEVVHHINGDKSDNRNSNLLICSNQYHCEIESKMADLYKKEHFS